MLLALAALWLGQGCGDRLGVPDGGTSRDKTCLNFSVAAPERGGSATRSISESITSLWVLVFDHNGFFVECRQAVPVTPNVFGTDPDTEYKFEVELQASPMPRTLHFVANYDFASHYPDYNNEYYLMSHLSVKRTDAAAQSYWQRVVLENGIPEAAADFSAADLTKLTKIPLVRNFAQVSLRSSTPEFVVEGFALLNVPEGGSVAPCVRENSGFAVYHTEDLAGDVYGTNPWVSRSYDDLSASYDGVSSVGYTGFLTADLTIDSSVPTDADFTTGDKYIYERPYSGDNTNTSIIVKGSYNGGATTYFKIDFVKEVNPENGFNVYYNILRNFRYEVDITKCSTSGYDTVADAINAPSMNNFLFSVDTQDYSNISDGTARLFVEYTEKTLVTTDPFEFKIKYVPDIRNAPGYTVYTGTVKVRDKDTKMVFAPGGTYTPEESAVVKSISLKGSDVVSSKDSDGWLHLMVTPQPLPSSGALTQSVVFYVMDPSDTAGKTLLVARTVILHLRQPSTMRINMRSSGTSPDLGIPLTASAEFLMNLYLPTGLNKSVFPLDFKIESATNNLTPDASKNADTYRSGYMSTWTGTSITGSGKQTFGFTKSLTYDEYVSLATFGSGSYAVLPCAFKTTKATTSGTNTIYVSNPYFTPNPTTYSVER